MTTDVKRYLRALKRSLPCEGAPKKRLMASFHGTLSAFLEETPNPDMLTLLKAFGPPSEMANVLGNDLTSNEIRRARAERFVKRGLTCLVIAAGIVLATLVIHSFYFEIKPITIIEQTFVGDPADYPYDIDYPLGE